VKTDPRIDDYIAAAPVFARPLLEELRARVHRALPDAEETIKWNVPHFTVAGKNIAGMSAFKAHVSFGLHGDGRELAMRNFTKIAAVDDLPDEDAFVQALKETAAHQTRPRKMQPRKAATAMAVPDDLAAALAAHARAQATFEGFAPSHRNEYIQWITEAKTEATRARRIAQAAEWIGEGKKRNWKYEKC